MPDVRVFIQPHRMVPQALLPHGCAEILTRIKDTLPLLQDIIDACEEHATCRGA